MAQQLVSRAIILLFTALALMGCQDRYRYDCQDPANWQEEICKKPKCIAMGYCTEWLINTGEDEQEHEAH